MNVSLERGSALSAAEKTSHQRCDRQNTRAVPSGRDHLKLEPHSANDPSARTPFYRSLAIEARKIISHWSQLVCDMLPSDAIPRCGAVC